MNIFEVVRQGDAATFAQRVQSVTALDDYDENGWTLLHGAAGRGNLEMVKLLVERGADIFKRGEDNRTPYLIALAAAHTDVARYLQSEEEAKGGEEIRGSSGQAEQRKYCQAFPLDRLRKFSAWEETDLVQSEGSIPAAEARREPRSGENIVFLHQDYSVTETARADERVVFRKLSAEWKLYCVQTLGFRVPSDLELVAAE